MYVSAQFIKQCPTSNPPLPVQPFPALTVSNAAPHPGSDISLKIGGSPHVNGPAYVAWLDGLTVTFSKLRQDGTTTVTEGLVGTVYAAVVARKDQIPSDALRKELRDWVVKEIGALARPDDIRFTESLPKTRSGKIMRRLLRDIAAGRESTGDTTTLEDFNVLAKLREHDEG